MQDPSFSLLPAGEQYMNSDSLWLHECKGFRSANGGGRSCSTTDGRPVSREDLSVWLAAAIRLFEAGS